MIIKSRLIITVMMAILLLSACQTVPKITNEVASEVPSTIVIERLDSDGDGVYDESDACPNTDINSVANTYGCPLISHTGYENINKSRVLYLENSSEISVIDIEKLDSIVEVLQEYPESVLFIEAHIARSEYLRGSDSLARSRAERLKNHMIMNYDIRANRIGAYYCSYDRPYASNDDPESRHKNQRANIELESAIPKSIGGCKRLNY